MADQDTYSKLSFLFGTEQQHRIRKFVVACNEKLWNTFPTKKHTQVVLSGSTSDGVAYPPSDDDTMIVFTSPELLVRSSVDEAVQYNAPLLIPSDTSPGYCLLWIPDVDRHPYRADCVNCYFSSLAWKIKFLEESNYLHGPCISGFICNFEFDFASCLYLPRWPDIATEWIYRDREHFWPSSSVLQQIVKRGCHVVPIGDPASPMADHQWRVSFSLAERTLVHTFNHTQFLIYNVLKLVLKRIINVHEPDCLCSYFIKTAMFYCIENTDSSLWDQERLELCYTKSLTLLYHFVDGMFCPNYFVKENNMFKRKINPTNRPRVLSLLQWILQLGILGALYHTEERLIIYIPVTVTRTEVKRDKEIFHGYLFGRLKAEIRTTIDSQSSYSPYILFWTILQIASDSASLYLTSKESSDLTLLILRYSSTLMAGKLDSECQSQVVNNKHSYSMRKCNKAFYEIGSHYDVSCGRLRYATHLYTVNDIDKCLTLIQETLSSMAPYVLVDECRVENDLRNLYEQALCGRNLSITEKCNQGFAALAEFHPHEHYVIPAPVAILMCQSDTVECSTTLHIDPVLYAYFLQGLCFIKLRNQTGLQNSMTMLKERMESKCYFEEAVYDHLSAGFSLLGCLELLQEQLGDAFRCFIKSYIYRERFKKILKAEKVNFTHLNLAIACNNLINGVLQ